MFWFFKFAVKLLVYFFLFFFRYKAAVFLVFLSLVGFLQSERSNLLQQRTDVRLCHANRLGLMQKFGKCCFE